MGTISQSQYECLDPRGGQGETILRSLNERINQLEEKTIYLVDINKKNSDVLLKKTMHLLNQRYPTAQLVYYPKTKGFTLPESDEWWLQLEKEADAAIVAVGD